MHCVFFLIFLVDREIDMGHSVVVLLVLLLLVLNIVRVDRVEANLLVVLSINNVYDYLHIASLIRAKNLHNQSLLSLIRTSFTSSSLIRRFFWQDIFQKVTESSAKSFKLSPQYKSTVQEHCLMPDHIVTTTVSHSAADEGGKAE